MGWDIELDIKQINKNHFSFGSVFALKTSALVLASLLLNAYLSSTVAEGRQQSDKNAKKKVVIVGEMSDMIANESLRSIEPDVYQTSEDYHHYYEDHDDYNREHNRIRRYKPIPSSAVRPVSKHVRRKSPGSMFVPVAAYSVTKTKGKPTRSSSNVYRKRQGMPIRRNPDLDNKQTESAVYGYMQRPEIIEFRGQYFYGARPGEPLDGPLTPAASNVEGMKYPPYPLDPTDPLTASATNSFPNYYGGNKLKGTGGLGPGGLLLATLPLILAPMLSYLFTPMIIPITATVAAGRRRRSAAPSAVDVFRVTADTNASALDQNLLTDGSFEAKSSANSRHSTGSPYASAHEWLESDRLNDPKYKEAQVVVEYLRKVHFDERATTRAVANYLQCDGMLADEDHCIERLSCEFSDPNNLEAPELDRAVTSIILGHILANEYITDSFKIKLKLAAIYGKDSPGMCSAKFECAKVETDRNHP